MDLFDPETLEPFNRYIPGGFHPVAIGDTFYDGKYRVLHRVGRGAYSTVWLAENLHYEVGASTASQPTHAPAAAARYVAIKIFAADTPAGKLGCSIRRPLPQTIVSSPSSIGAMFVVSLLEEFEIEGPNGFHKAVAMDLAGPSIAEVMRYRAPLPVEVGRQAVAQCAKGLAYLHSTGLVHGGMHPGIESAIDNNGMTGCPCRSSSGKHRLCASEPGLTERRRALWPYRRTAAYLA